MQIRTLFLYLIGNRQAILELAANPRALWIGLLFVLSAGFAREYDGHDLLREPWHIVIPLGASLAASFLLFLVVCGSLYLQANPKSDWTTGRHPEWPSFFSAYRSFLTLFWMTAPLAWFYAIPYERFLSEAGATSANLWSLGLVAAWRVVLMIRVCSVLTNRSVWASIFLVMAFADAVALFAVWQMPAPVVEIMGGVRQTESEVLVGVVTFYVGCLGFLSAPFWAVGGLIAFTKKATVAWNVPPGTTPTAISCGVWCLAVGSLVIWLPILPFTQSELVLRDRVERDLKAGRIAEALDVMSAHQPSDFPPHWNPPPRIGYRDGPPDILDVMEVLVSREHATWVRVKFAEKLRRNLGSPYAPTFGMERELPRILKILEQIPEGPDIAEEHRWAMTSRLEREKSDEVRSNLRSWLALAAKSTKWNR
jgi:hypothetical protein